VCVLLGLMLAVGARMPATPQGFVERAGIVQNLVVANLSLFAFNLIPAFPMDGGRVMRALLTFVTTEERATRVAAAVGQAIAVGFFVLWLFQPAAWWLALIGLFVFLGAGQEAAFQTRRAMVRGRIAREAMLTRFDVLAPQDTLGRAAELLLETSQQDFPVVDAWKRVVGILPRSLLLQGLAQAGKGAAVLEIMRRDPTTVPSTAPLDDVLRRIQTDPGAPVIVSDGEGIVGMITLENLAEFIELARRTR
jgi:CBS domain-containing protein